MNDQQLGWEFSDFNNNSQNANTDRTNNVNTTNEIWWSQVRASHETNTTWSQFCYIVIWRYHVIFWPFTNFTHSSFNCHLTDATHNLASNFIQLSKFLLSANIFYLDNLMPLSIFSMISNEIQCKPNGFNSLRLTKLNIDWFSVGNE